MTLQLRICIDVDDLERGIAFYRDALGLSPGRRLNQVWAEMLGASSPIDLLVAAAGTPSRPGSKALRDYRRHWTPVHLDCAVIDLDEAVRRAQSAGARLEQGPQAKKWGRLAILEDPFGNGFCLLEFRGRGYEEMLGG